MQLQVIQKKIYEVRGLNVMLDYDLAELYETSTKRLKEAVRRNIDRFPEDFMFELNSEEVNLLRSQFATLKKGRGRHSKYAPFAFTEQEVARNKYTNHKSFRFPAAIFPNSQGSDKKIN